MTWHKEQFLNNLRMRYPQAKDDDELYDLAMKSYHNEHEFAKKTRAENQAFAENIQAHPELLQLISSLFSPGPYAAEGVDTALMDLTETLTTPYIKQLESELAKFAKNIEAKLLNNTIFNANHSVPRFSIRYSNERPKEFTTVECIAAAFQTGLELNDIYPNLQSDLLSIIEQEHGNLKDWEKFFLKYKKMTIEEDETISGVQLDEISRSVLNEFRQVLREVDVERRMKEIKEAKENEVPSIEVLPIYPYMDELNSLRISVAEPAPAELKGFAAVAGLHELKAKLQNDIIDVIREPERAKALKISLPNGMLLYGPPGCGKTYFAEKLAEETGFSFKYVNCSDIASTYIHGTQEKIAAVFKEANENSPCLVFFDEVDAMIQQRGMRGSEYTQTEVNEFLTQLNNCGKRGVVVIGATNRPQDIDTAALRSGRLEYKYYFPLPDYDARVALFNIHLHDVRWFDKLDTDEFARKTEGYVSADIQKIVDVAKNVAFKDKRNFIKMEDLRSAIAGWKPSVSQDELKQMESIRDKFENRHAERPKIGFC